MHFHLPKPLHGWRAFVGEVGIIVLGVLIALSAEQVVETLHMRSETDAVRATMRDELANDRARWEVTHAQYPCFVKRLDELEKWSKSAPVGANLMHVERPFLWNAHVSTWEMARGSPAVANMPLAERDSLASLYQALEIQQEQANVSTSNAWRKVAALAEAGDDPQNRRALRLAIIDARQSTEQLENAFDYLEPRFVALGIKPDFGDLHVIGRPLTYVTATNCPPVTRAG